MSMVSDIGLTVHLVPSGVEIALTAMDYRKGGRAQPRMTRLGWRAENIRLSF